MDGAVEKMCFVVSPIGEKGSKIRENADKFFEDIVDKTCVDLGYTPIRADKVCATGDINRLVVEHLEEAALVIADLTGFNPNVFFEVGYRYALGGNIILMRNKSDDKGVLPFDVSTTKVISYSFEYRDVVAVKSVLAETIAAIEPREAFVKPETHEGSDPFTTILETLVTINDKVSYLAGLPNNDLSHHDEHEFVKGMMEGYNSLHNP